MKRASNLVVQRRAVSEQAEAYDSARRMVAYTARRLPEAGYHPYYLYRQAGARAIRRIPDV